MVSKLSEKVARVRDKVGEQGKKTARVRKKDCESEAAAEPQSPRESTLSLKSASLEGSMNR